MTELAHLRHRMATEQRKVQLESCTIRRQAHEDQVRAYAKLIAIFERERLGALVRRAG